MLAASGKSGSSKPRKKAKKFEEKPRKGRENLKRANTRCQKLNYNDDSSDFEDENIEIDTIQPSQVLQSTSNDKVGKSPGQSAQNVVQSNKCDTRNARFSKKRKLKKDATLAHKGPKLFQCKICPEDFPHVCLLKKHIRSVHKKQFHCERCEKSFSRKKELKKHIESVHDGKPFECGICDQSFSKKPNLEAHIKTVHEGKKPYPCEHCDKSFSKKQSLERHIEAVHEGKKPYTCEHCDKNFAHKPYL